MRLNGEEKKPYHQYQDARAADASGPPVAAPKRHRSDEDESSDGDRDETDRKEMSGYEIGGSGKVFRSDREDVEPDRNGDRNAGRAAGCQEEPDLKPDGFEGLLNERAVHDDKIHSGGISAGAFCKRTVVP